ncbi:MAG: hypothetical protein ACLFPW_08925 [Spirochaetaceae bacterium]
MSQRPESLASGYRGILLRRVLEGYRHLFGLIAGVLPLLGAIIFISGAIVIPLWYLATYHRTLFTGVVIVLVVGGTLFGTIRAILRRRQGRHLLAKAALTVTTLSAVYLGVRLLAFQRFPAAVLVLLIAIFLTGLALAPKRRV